MYVGWCVDNHEQHQILTLGLNIGGLSRKYNVNLSGNIHDNGGYWNCGLMMFRNTFTLRTSCPMAVFHCTSCFTFSMQHTKICAHTRSKQNTEDDEWERLIYITVL